MTSKRVQLAQTEETLAAWGLESLQAVIAIDSQSDERSETLPSSQGQRDLSAFLQDFFQKLGYTPEIDEFANLLVPIPSNVSHAQVPTIALMAHLDTSQGTQAIPELLKTPAWDGQNIHYPANPRLQVSVDEYPQTRIFLGEDLLHGPGDAPIGLDDKLGMTQLMVMARLLAENPSIEHGEILLVFRPDEEIGRMEVIQSLAEQLQKRDVKFGYTADGLDPFEVNVENFNASRVRVTFQGQPLALQGQHLRQIDYDLEGVKSHGATAKAEGYRNAIRLTSEILRQIPNQQVLPVRFQSNVTSEVNATLSLLLHATSAAELETLEQQVSGAFETVFSPQKKRGAQWAVLQRQDVQSAEAYTDEVSRAFQMVAQFLQSEGGPSPLLSEDSEGFEGYSNPYFIDQKAQQATLDFRIRDFSPEQRKAREEHVTTLAARQEHAVAEVAQQYINMGPALEPYPQLLAWAQDAAQTIGQTAVRQPIRGGTGVDPFLERGIPVANMGTGYFAPESEKEFTSLQSLVRHILWHVQLAHHIAQQYV
ncbi:MAG: M20/M25/M40 family metallo-hydrolase [Myxococcales bacterium]|nr:M20/M25/M40 family metallo-hydrolase [Myxococcales bacterium]MCB9644468.1 M20/M25/M40 family metallo-hydrolase [Myxococcales bacterium]